MITQLEIENFKRLTAVTISPDGSVVLGGNNRQGKTSCLDAIEAALGGKRRIPDEPIRKGKKKARIILTTDDLVVTRTFSKSGSQIKVEAKDGTRYPSPQKMLDDLMGSLSFDPIEFTGMGAEKQAETLRALAGLDFNKIHIRRARLYAERADINRDGKQARARLDAAPFHKDAPPERVSHSALLEDLEQQQAILSANNIARRHVVSLGEAAAVAYDDAAEALDGIAAAERALLAAEGRSDRAEKAHALALSKFHEERDAAAALVDPDIDGPRSAMDAAEDNNRKFDDNQAHAELAADLEALAAKTRELKKAIDDCDEEKADMIAAAKYPIEGLAAEDDCVTLNGVPFQQASHAEQLECSVAIGLALNPKLKVLLVRDGSALDPNSLAQIMKMADDAGAQLWIERVGHGDECTVVIEDGAVAEGGG